MYYYTVHYFPLNFLSTLFIVKDEDDEDDDNADKYGNANADGECVVF
jgi:hypothetical protein